jgi:hypothetical protein
MSSGDHSVALDADAVHVQGAQFTLTSSGVVYPLNPMSRLQYIETANDKATPTTGDPEYYYVTNQNGTRKLFMWPAAPGAGTLNYWSTDAHTVVSTNVALDIPDRLHMWFLMKLVHVWSFDFGKRLEEIDRYDKLAAAFWPESIKAEGEEQQKDVRPDERIMKRRW